MVQRPTHQIGHGSLPHGLYLELISAGWNSKTAKIDGPSSCQSVGQGHQILAV